MRSHVFPVCKPGSELKEFSNPLDSIVEGTNNYLSENKDIISLSSNGSLVTSLFSFLNASKGEFLIDFPDVSFPEGTINTGSALDIRFSNSLSYEISLQAAWREKLNDVGLGETPKEGQIACVAIKRLDPVFNNPASIGCAALNYVGNKGDDSYGYNYPFGTLDFFDINYGLLNESKWVTLMFTGTRWVLLGSNNWY